MNTEKTAINRYYFPMGENGDETCFIKLNGSSLGQTLEINCPSINIVGNTTQTIVDSQNVTGDVEAGSFTLNGTTLNDWRKANTNSSDFWDNLNTPADINAADITNDGTYLLATGDTGTGNYEFTNNISQPVNQRHCFGGCENSSIFWNGTALIIKVN